MHCFGICMVEFQPKMPVGKTLLGWVFSEFLCKFSKKEFNHLNQMVTPEMKPNKGSGKETFSKGKSVIQKKKKGIYLR